jgi:hypothetical protein
LAALLKLPIFVGLPPKGPRTPPGTLFCAGWVCWHPGTLGAHAAAAMYCGGQLRYHLICKYVPNYYKEH